MMRGGYLLIIFVYITNSTNVVDGKIQIQDCKVGDVAQNECLQCVCTTEHIYKCIPKDCSNSSMENLQRFKKTNGPTCQPNVVYTTDTMTCICNKTGYWPHGTCEEILQNLNNTSSACETNSYVILDCNVCRCSPEGKIDKERCTTNICESTPNTRRHMSNVYGSCEIKNWYSLAPCQFCFCISENKLVCNTGNHYAKKLDLGSYHLNVCGQGLIYEAIALIPDNDKILRFGNFINTTATTTPRLITTSKYVKLLKNPVIDANKKNEIIKEKYNQQYKEESYSESEENNAVTPKKVKETSSTQLPYPEDVEESSSENGYYSDKKDLDSGLEIGVEDGKLTSKRVMKTMQKVTTISPTIKSNSEETLKELGQNLGMTLKMSLPHTLDQMFKMALRKSMLSLKGDTKCVPGTTNVVKCNMCFCMKNGKLLCTNNICE